MSRESAKARYDREPNDPLKGYLRATDAQAAVDDIYNDLEAIQDDSLSLSQGGQVDGSVEFTGPVAFAGTIPGQVLQVDSNGYLTPAAMPAGQKGDKGDKGDTGDPGPIGESAYSRAVANGFVGTEAQWLESLRSTLPGPIGPAPNIQVGTTTTGTANVVRSGTNENPVFTFTLPSAGANGVNTAAIQDGAVTAPKIGALTAKGDLLARDASGAVRLPVGTDGQVLQADSTAAAGVAWKPLGNLLTANQASCGDTLGDLTGITAATNCTVARSTAWAASGTGSVLVTQTGGVSYRARFSIPTDLWRSFVGRTITVAATMRGASGTGTGFLQIGSSVRNYSSQSTSVMAAGTSYLVTHTFTVPADESAAIANLDVWASDASGTGSFYVDQVGLWRGQGGSWSMPGQPITGLKPLSVYQATTATLTMSALQDVIAADTTSGAVTVTLPDAALCVGQTKRIIKVAGANTLTVQRAGSDTIVPSSGTRTSVAFPSDCAMGEIVLVSTGSAWHVVSGQASDEAVGSRLYKWSQAQAAGSTTAAVGWRLVGYDSGWREVTSSMAAAFQSSNANARLHIKRVGSLVSVHINETAAGSGTGTVTIYTIPAAFRPARSIGAVACINPNNGIPIAESLFANADTLYGFGWTAVRHFAEMQYETAATLPSALPGTAA